MGSLSATRIVRRSEPAQMTIVKHKAEGETVEKENLMRKSLYSITFEKKGKDHPQDSPGAAKDRMGNALQPRKRGLNERTAPAPQVVEHSRELTPPQLTSSDEFKPAKRTLIPKPGHLDSKLNQLPQLDSPVPTGSDMKNPTSSYWTSSPVSFRRSGLVQCHPQTICVMCSSHLRPILTKFGTPEFQIEFQKAAIESKTFSTPRTCGLVTLGRRDATRKETPTKKGTPTRRLSWQGSA